MTYTADSHAVLSAVKTYYAEGVLRLAAESMAAVLSEHKTTLQAMVESQARAIDTYRATIKRLRKKLRRAERDAVAVCGECVDAKAHPAIVLPEVTDEDVDAFRQAWAYVPWREAVRAALNAYRRRLTTALPVWQPVEPGTWVGIGQRLRYESVEGTSATEHVTVKEAVIGGRGWSILRTVPAEPEPEPVDPDAHYIEAMAKAMAAGYAEADADWTADARRALAAYRAECDKEA